jgi:dethiobiotin synthetase
MARGLFVTGTGTGVGKTYVAALIARHLAGQAHRVGVYKPVASGCRRLGSQLVSDDGLALWRATGRRGALDRVCPQRFAAHLAPHLAAQAEGGVVDEDRLRRGIAYWQARSDVVVVEGVGGLLSPVSESLYCADLATGFGYPLVVVAPNSLGSINATLQTLIAAAVQCPDLAVAGVVLSAVHGRWSDASAGSNQAEIARRSSVSVVTSAAWQATGLDQSVDWFGLADQACLRPRGQWVQPSPTVAPRFAGPLARKPRVAP